ncbi:MAG: hypothetical protein EXR55_07065 [Dehalococcoidia bacterium]|nr:hypothetical protein [Dehalococcoidia bacterium]
MVRQAIRREGDHAVARFLELVDGSRASGDQKKGDAVVLIDKQDFYVEIKECHAPPGRSGTLNQIRPIKYTPLMVQAPQRGCWYVVPAGELVRMAANKDRGQHTEIAFECMNLTLAQLEGEDSSRQTWVFHRVSAVPSSQAHAMKALMNELLQAIRKLGEDYKHRVNAL